MDKIILPALRSHVPGIPSTNGKPTWHLPIHVHTDKGIDLDFGPLLLFDKAIIDSNSAEYINTSGRAELAPLRKSLEVLAGEGFVETRDFGSQLSSVRNVVTLHVDRLIDHPIPLREPYLRGLDSYRASLPVIQGIASSCNSEFMSLGFGMHLLMLKRFGRFDPKEKDRLDRLMVAQKRRWSASELDDIKELIRPTITYLYQNMVLSEMFGSPFLDVDYTSELYNILRRESLRAFDGESQVIDKTVSEGQRFFDCVVPHLRPTSPQKMLKLLRNPAMKDFRAYVTCAAHDGRSISKEEYARLLTQTISAERHLSHMKGTIAWGERVLSLIPGMGVLSSALGLVVEKVASRRVTGKYEWLCALIDSASTGKP